MPSEIVPSVDPALAELRHHIQQIRLHAEAAYVVTEDATEACCDGLLRALNVVRVELESAISTPFVSRSNRVIARMQPDLTDFVDHLRLPEDL